LQSSSLAFFARSLDQFFFLVTEEFVNFHSDRPSSSREASPHFPDSFDVHSVVVLLLVVAGRSVGSRVPLVAVWSTIILLLSAGRLLGWFVFLFFSFFFFFFFAGSIAVIFLYLPLSTLVRRLPV
jgi:hypothetical protein